MALVAPATFGRGRRDSGDLSTLVSQPAPQPSWKQEVNRRLEAHKSRKGIALAPRPLPAEEHGSVSDRAARAAARVAARYAKVPSYSEMQASEARAALRAAEAATRAALEAQAAAQIALDNLEASSEEFDAAPEEMQSQWPESTAVNSGSSAISAPIAEAPVPVPPPVPVEIRWEPDLPQRPQSIPSAPPASSSDSFIDDAWPHTRVPDSSLIPEPAVETVEAAQPIHANLIHFPRELVATRRVRPRLAGSLRDLAEDQFGQLSIFEVDPSSISIEPTASVAGTTAPAQTFGGAEWSGIKLGAEPEIEPSVQTTPDPPARAAQVQLAPRELRIMAAVVDAALIIGLVCAGAWGLGGHLHHAIPLKTAEMYALLAFVFTAIGYQTFFLLTTLTTPGMMYAGVALCTFDDEYPTRAQLRGRLGALLISLLPVGLGMAWAFFDEDHLSWHDRLSGTYPRKC